jgi:outer membrane protein OmpA-like peptidoglycan-associated protein
MPFSMAAAVLAGLAVMIAAAPATEAQRRPGGSSVTIDYSVLQSLGPAPTVPRLLLPTMPRPQLPMASAMTRRLPAGRTVATGQRIVLRPPGRGKAKRVPKRSRPARRAIAKSMRVSPPRSGKPKVLKPSPSQASARSIARMQKPAAKKPIPRPAIKSTLIPPAAKVPTAASPAPASVSARVKPPPPPPSPAARAPAPAAPPSSARAPAPPASPTQTASLPSGQEAFGAGRSYRLEFAPGSSKLGADSIARLDEIAAGAKADEAIRLKLLAYAGAAGQTASQSRRLSLSRALTVRSYLIDKGVGSVRFEVQAKGQKLEGGPPDRVDVIVTKR